MPDEGYDAGEGQEDAIQEAQSTVDTLASAVFNAESLIEDGDWLDVSMAASAISDAATEAQDALSALGQIRDEAKSA